MLSNLSGILGKRSTMDSPFGMEDMPTGRTVTSLVSGSFGFNMDDLGDRTETEPDRINLKRNIWDVTEKNEFLQAPREGDIVFTWKDPRNLKTGLGTTRGAVSRRVDQSLNLYGTDTFQYLCTGFTGINYVLAYLDPDEYTANKILNDMVECSGVAITSHDGKGVFDRPWDRTEGAILSYTKYGKVESVNNYWGNYLTDSDPLYILLVRGDGTGVPRIPAYHFGKYYAEKALVAPAFPDPWHFKPWVPSLGINAGRKVPKLDDVIYPLGATEQVGAIIRVGIKLSTYDIFDVDEADAKSSHMNTDIEHSLPRCAIQLWPSITMFDE